MGVVAYPQGFGGGIDHELREEVKKLSSKIDRLIEKLDSNNSLKSVEKGTFVLKCKSNLVWWTKVNDAARYCLSLFIDGDEVGTTDLERETRYYAFEKLPKGINFVVKVVAEDRDGKELVSSSIEL